MQTANGTKAHYVPHDSLGKESLCGVKADKYTDETSALQKCKRCEKTRHLAQNGEHDDYESHQVA